MADFFDRANVDSDHLSHRAVVNLPESLHFVTSLPLTVTLPAGLPGPHDEAGDTITEGATQSASEL